jgi:hypothetical protein
MGLKYTMFENGIDSFKAAYNSIEKIIDFYDGGYHHYKDAILSINHANEILFKHMLKERLELLLFDDLKAYIKAKASLKDSGKNNVLEIDRSLKTVNLLDALRRLRDLCDVEVPDSFYNSILYLNDLRNKIMHFEIEIQDDELPNVKKALELCYTLSRDFFEIHLGGIDDALNNARYEILDDDIEEYFANQAYDRMIEEQNDRYDAQNLAIDEALEDAFEGKAT